MKFAIGIDTGGTYTDAVVFDFSEKKIVASAKALTTKEDLSIGIGNALDALPAPLLAQAAYLSLSTTLATNACVQNKGGRAALVLIGVDEKVVAQFGKEYGLAHADNLFFLNSSAQFVGSMPVEPDFQKLRTYAKNFSASSVGIVELYAMKNDGILEKKARDIFTEFGIPTICSHELFSDLNSIKRGASALLNARLIPVIDDFLKAINAALKSRKIELPVVIVRSDATLMSEHFTGAKPIETLLCGPAASVMGAMTLTNKKNCLVVDMGGTTTDIALVKNGIPVRSQDGIHVGEWQTFVKGLYIDTFALGGDTAIRYKNGKLVLETDRLLPLCILAEKYPQVKNNLQNLLTSNTVHTQYLHEFFVAVRDISQSPHYTVEEKKLCAMLKDNPLPLAQAAHAMGKSLYGFDTARLEKEGVLLKSGLTPTDIMHIKGDFKQYDAQASLMGAQYVGRCLGKDTAFVCEEAYELVTRRIYCNIVRILLNDRYTYYQNKGLDEQLSYLIDRSYDMAKAGEKGFVDVSFSTPACLIGIGAPIHIFLPIVAKLLKTTCIIPKNAAVANALGAVVGNISSTITLEIRPNYTSDSIDGYTVYGTSQNNSYADFEAALQYAKKISRSLAKADVLAKGANSSSITIKTQLIDAPGDAHESVLYLGSKVISTAVSRISV
ncbi:MAG: hydantoinase/oxoprolinase family protein [Christensenellaceae bacterium]